MSATHVFIAVTLMVLQTTRRFYDTCFISVFSKKAKMNLSHYFIGMAYYPAVMLIILSEAPKFVADYSSDMYDNIGLEDVGIVEFFSISIFLWAWYHQHVATVILANLRKNDAGNLQFVYDILR